MARKHAALLPASGYTILVVDDYPDSLTATALCLRAHGYGVVTASSGEQALALFQPGQIDLLLVNYFMRAMRGDELIRRVRTMDKRVRIVLQSGYAGERPPPPDLLCTFDIQAYHAKADGIEELVRRIEGALSAAAPAQACVC